MTPEFTGEPEIVDGKKFIGRRGALKRLAGLAGGILFVSERSGRGGNVAMQAFVGGSVDYAGTSFDVALQAHARGAKSRLKSAPFHCPRRSIQPSLANFSSGP
jgi:hypothetical protein